MADGANGRNGKTNGNGHGEFKPSPPPWEHPAYYDNPPDNLWPEEKPPEPEPEILRLNLLYGSQTAEAPLHQDTVVQGLLHLGSLSLIYGKPKSGKSFLATDLARAVADPDRTSWMNHRIKQHGPVLYVACEGHGGFWKRMQASGPVPDNFVLALGRPKLIINPDLKGYSWVPYPKDVELAIAQVLLHFQREPVLVIIDTVFRSFGGGDVNKSADMNAYVASCQKIADRQIAVALVHHANKGNSMPSGSISLMGGADTLILVERDKDAQERTWQVDEAKDGAETGPRLFDLEVVDGIMDRFGDPQSSCRVVDLGYAPLPEEKPRRGKAKVEPEAEPEPKEPTQRPRSADQDLMLRELGALFQRPGVPQPRAVIPTGDPVSTVTRDQLRDHLLDQGHITRSEVDGTIRAEDRRWVHKQLTALHRRFEVHVAGDWISIGTGNDTFGTGNDLGG